MMLIKNCNFFTKTINRKILKIFQPNTFLAKSLFALVVIGIISLGIVPFYKHIHASGSFTVSNITFDPATGRLRFDYTGTLTTGAGHIVDSSSGNNLWTAAYTSCNGTTCSFAMDPDYFSDSGTSSVEIEDGVGDISQTLNYPLPYSSTNTPQYPSVGGWINVGETWTYASSNSFTISGDETSVYTSGTRIMATNNSTTYYGTVEGSSYSSPNTTVTLVANSDYSLSNSAITNTYYSYQANPRGYPGWFNYATTWGGFSTNPTGTFKFSIIGRTCYVDFADSTSEVSNSTATTFTVPVAPARSESNFAVIFVYNNSAMQSTPGVLQSAAGSTTVQAFTSFYNGAWGSSGGKAIFPGTFTYEF